MCAIALTSRVKGPLARRADSATDLFITADSGIGLMVAPSVCGRRQLP